MSKKFLRNKKNDGTCLDDQSSNKIKVIVILLGIYDEYRYKLSTDKCVPDFESYYCDRMGNEPYLFLDQTKTYYLLNRGAQFLVKICQDQAINTTGKRIKRMCATYHAKAVCIPVNTRAVLSVLFEYIDDNHMLKNVFINIILNECQYYTRGLNHYPDNCRTSILGFVYVFLDNVAQPNLIYSEKDRAIAMDILNDMNSNINKLNLKEKCILKVLERRNEI